MGTRPPPRRCARPTTADVRASPPHKRVRPTPLVCAPPNSRAHPILLACASPNSHAPTPNGCTPPADVRVPLLAGVRALQQQACMPSPPPCTPPRRRARSACSRAHPAPTNARAFVAGGRTRYIRKGPSHSHFTTLGFVSWDSFVGSLHEVVGMVQHFRFLPF
jgi:hypothetical protein